VEKVVYEPTAAVPSSRYCAEREVPPGHGGNQPVGVKAEQRPGAADDHDRGPHQHVHRTRTRTLLTMAVDSWMAAYPAAIEAAA
jgi:hypothetical protein